MTECKKNSDENRLIREGATQEERFPPALDPAYAPVDDWKIEHGILFAKAYAKFLKYYDTGNREAGDWQPFFSKDVSALLAVMAMQDIEECRNNIKNILEALKGKTIKELGKFINCIGIIAKQIDILKEGLPDEYLLKAILSNLVKNRLDDDFKEVILCCRDYFGTDASSLKECNPSFKVIRSESCTDIFTLLEEHTFSIDWIPETKTPEDKKKTWIEYLRDLYEQPEKSSLTADEEGINKLFEISNRFLMAYARTVTEARRAFEDSLTKWNRHEPHYALFLAFLRLMKHARNELNTLTGRHLDFYYREILQFKEKEVVPPKTHVLVELAKQVPSYLIKAGEEFKAGKDELGKDVFFASERDFMANRAKVTELKTVFRYQPNKEEFNALPEITGKNTVNKKDAGRIYAASVANLEDSQSGDLISEDKSWHPFFNKKYENGKVSEIKMPKAEIGFAIASHYLWMDGGKRIITVFFECSEKTTCLTKFSRHDISCLLTNPNGWTEIKSDNCCLRIESDNKIVLSVILSGSDYPVVPYSEEKHKYNFQTDLPVLLVKLQQDAGVYSYDSLRTIKLNKIDLKVCVEGLKKLAVSNDFGPVDTSKPFQPFGASPVKNSSLIIGSKEAFQKRLFSASIQGGGWLIEPKLYSSDSFDINYDYLQNGRWIPSTGDSQHSLESFDISKNLDYPVTEKPNFSPDEFYSTASQYGFVRLKLLNDFGWEAYQTDLRDYLINKSKIFPPSNLGDGPGTPPTAPVASEIILNYKTKEQTINLKDKGVFENRSAQFFHIAPFGQAEQHPLLKLEQNIGSEIFLFPHIALTRQDENENELDNDRAAAEFYIGITDLKPPQNLSLLFQVADGTANPEKEKPKYPHIHWSYLRNNEWIAFQKNAVEDSTDELITSGIITFAVPRDASNDNTLLPAEMHWIRAAVSSAPDAVCRLRMVEAQAVKVKFVDKENDPNFSAKTLLKDSITKLARPAAEVKKITQPFSSYGGRGKESSKAFYTRVSERLRHKDRAITLWDYERLILEAFPEVHKVKCLNHTSYEYDKKENKCVLNENAPGHVTVVTIANQEYHSLPDSLRPNVSLGLQKKIEEFLLSKLSNFVKLHIVNPKFEEVKVDFRVKFRQGFDETYSINMLQKDIVRFLSPWAFSGNGEPSFGGKIYKSALINFIEEQDYVDYLTCFKLMHLGVGNQEHDKEDHEEVQGCSSISILVSVQIGGHKITPIPSLEDGKYINENSPC